MKSLDSEAALLVTIACLIPGASDASITEVAKLIHKLHLLATITGISIFDGMRLASYVPDTRELYPLGADLIEKIVAAVGDGLERANALEVDAKE